MEALLNLPLNASVHGPQIDRIIVIVHWLMAALFVGWGSFFIYTLYRFRAGKNPKADYVGVKSHLSTYSEWIVGIIEAVLLVGFSIPVWSQVVVRVPSEGEALTVRVVAEQFVWNIHYPGPDGKFGKSSANLVDAESNPLGLDPKDPNGEDDITTINQLTLPERRPILIKLSSKDVIHSFTLTEMRVKQDVIPGMTIPVTFEATQTGDWEIACAQLCGLGHYRMRGFLKIVSASDYQTWLDEMAAEKAEEEAEADGEEVW